MLGQVCCDSNGKLNAQSVLLEAGPEQGGQQVPVDLSELKEYSLFPGQVSRRKPLFLMAESFICVNFNCIYLISFLSFLLFMLLL